jgi:hypothetical protein
MAKIEDFISLDQTDIPLERIIKEYIPSVNNFLYELYQIKKLVEDDSTRESAMGKFKLLIDLIAIYKNPEILKSFKEYQDEKEREKERIRLQRIEDDKRREGFLRFQRERESQRGPMFGDFWSSAGSPGNVFGSNVRRSSVSSDKSTDVKSDITEDDMDQEKFNDAINRAYVDILAKSTLQRLVEVKRGYSYITVVDDNDKADDKGKTDDKGKEDDDIILL